jgi:hypothetical protein
MEVVNLAATPREQKHSRFWRRQFAREITNPQIGFDVAFGAVGPILCFILDPIVFRGHSFGAPLLPDYQTFTYLFSVLQIILLLMWFTLSPQNPIGKDILAGALVTGGFFCTVVGLVLLPFSLMGIIFVIGLFGLTPFVSAFVYLRNSVRIFRSPKPAPSIIRTTALMGGIVLAVASPMLLSMEVRSIVSHSVNEIIHGDPQRAHLAVHLLIPFQYFDDAQLDKIVNAYLNEKDPERRALLKSCYQEIAGEDIETRARILRD